MKQRIILVADSGKVITDGKIYGRQIFLSEDRSAEDFFEISEEAYHRLYDESEGFSVV